VQVKLEQVPRIIAGAPSFGRLSTLESQSRHVQPTNKGVNHAANMILRNQLIQRHRKQRPLTPTFSLNESHEKCPRSREGIFSFVYRPAQCFVTVSSARLVQPPQNPSTQPHPPL